MYDEGADPRPGTHPAPHDRVADPDRARGAATVFGPLTFREEWPEAAQKVVELIAQYDEKESKMIPIIEREKSMLRALELYDRY